MHGATYRRDIDGLRAIAILSVIGFHVAPQLFYGGFIGVDMFFVISGYLITGILLRDCAAGNFSILRFYQRRVRRIFPALALVLFFCMALGWWVLFPEEYKELNGEIGGATVFISNFVLWKDTGYFDRATDFKPLTHLWSLGVEEQFYLLWPLLLWSCWRGPRTALFWLLALLATSFGMSIFFSPRYDAMSFYLPPTRFWELMAGGLLAYVQQARPAALTRLAPHRNALAALGLLLLAVALAFITQNVPYPSWRAGLPVLGTLLLILAGPQAWANRRLLSAGPVVWVGLISYPLYLWHWPLIAFLNVTEAGRASVAEKSIAALVAVGLAWATTQWLERPIRFGRWQHSTRCLWGVLACMTAIGVASVIVDTYDGLAELRGMRGGKFQDATSLESFRAGLPPCATRYNGKALSWCVTSRTGQANAALLGDSHADHLMPGIKALDKDRNWLLIGQSSCPPLGGIRTIENERPDVCAERNRTALDAVVADRAIRTVVVAMRGSVYLGDSIVPLTSPLTHRLESVDEEEEGDTEALFEAGLHRTVQSLEDSGKSVVLFLDVPEMDFFVERCIERTISIRRDASAQCRVPRPKLEAMRARYKRIVERVAQRHPGVRVYDGYDPLCNATHCYGGDATTLYYWNTNHLSIRGSRKVAADFLTWLER